MRVLFISASPIQKEISIGNTFLNVFSGVENVEFAGICTREGTPDPAVSRCYCITEKMLIRSLCGKGAAGAEIACSPTASVEAPKVEDNTARFVKTKRWNIFFLMQNLLWTLGRWKTTSLKAFVEDYQPDVIFTVLSEKIYLNRLILHIAAITGKKLMVYAWDNNYSLKRLSFSPFDWIGHFCNRRYMRKVAKKADKLYVISEVQKTDYEKAFRKPCTVITKGEDFSADPPVKTTSASPMRLVYTGNLYANRWKSLGMLASALERVNRNGVRAQLHIYSATPLTEAMKKALEIDGTSMLMGRVSSDEVERIQKEADILVHAEATDLKNRLTVRQSFSTKLVDYFRMARPIVAVGPKDIASIKYLVDYDTAVTADNEQELFEKLSVLLKDDRLRQEYAVRAYLCGRANHDKRRISQLLQQDLTELTAT